MLSMVFCFNLSCLALTPQEFVDLAIETTTKYIDSNTQWTEEQVSIDMSDNLLDVDTYLNNNLINKLKSVVSLDVTTLNKVEYVEKKPIENQIFFNVSRERPLIVDLDMGSDVDDVCALSMVCAFDKLNLVDLKGVGLSVLGENDANISATRGFLKNANLSKTVPIGKNCSTNYDTSQYWDQMGGSGDSKTEVYDAVKLYRKILAESPNRVDIITTGYLTNIEGLLKSQADEYSNLNGIDLVREKCGQLYITGGAIDVNGLDNNFFVVSEAVQSSRYVNDNWPLTLVYFSSNVGGKLTTGQFLVDEDTQLQHSVTRCLRDFWYESGFDWYGGRAGWDAFVVFEALFGNDKEIGRITYVADTMTINPNGSNTFGTSNGNMTGRPCYRAILDTTDLNYYNTVMDSFLFYDALEH